VASNGFVFTPDLFGLSAVDAWLAGHQLALVVVGPHRPADVTEGRVWKQLPPPGASAMSGSEIRVWLDAGSGGSGVRAPRQAPTGPRPV